MRAKPSRAVLALILAAGMGGVASAGAAAAAPAVAASQPANAVRPEFGKPFTEAQDLMKANKGTEALAKLNEAEAVGNLSPFEAYLVKRVRAPAEYATGDLVNAAKDFEVVLASDQLPASDRVLIMKALSEILYSDKQYAKAAVWMQRYIDAGGNDAQIRDLLPQTLYMTKDYAAASKAFQAQVDAQYAAGQKPNEKTLRLLASSQTQSNDDAGYEKTIERLAVGYPKPEYWKDLISRAAHVEKLTDRLYVDVYRLKAAAFGQVADSERLSYGALALRAGFPAEAKRVIDEGMAKNAFAGADLVEAKKLGESSMRAAAQDRAQATANEAAAKAAKDGNALVTLGLLDTMDGNAAHGVDLLEQGVARGGLKFADEARLHLGMAQLRAGRSADALKTFQAITASGGLGSLAHVWGLLAQSQMQTSPAPAAASTAAAG